MPDPATDPPNKKVNFADLARRVREMRSQGQTPNIGSILQKLDTAPAPARPPTRPPAKRVDRTAGEVPAGAGPHTPKKLQDEIDALRAEIGEFDIKNASLLDELGRAKIQAKESADYRTALGDAMEREKELIERLEKALAWESEAEKLRDLLAEQSKTLEGTAGTEHSLLARIAEIEDQLAAAGALQARVDARHEEAILELRSVIESRSAAHDSETAAKVAEIETLRGELAGRDAALEESARYARTLADQRDGAKNEIARLQKMHREFAEQHEALARDLQLANESLVASHLMEIRDRTSAIEALQRELAQQTTALAESAKREHAANDQLELAKTEAMRRLHEQAQLDEKKEKEILGLRREIADQKTALHGLDKAHAAATGALQKQIDERQASLDAAAARADSIGKDAAESRQLAADHRATIGNLREEIARLNSSLIEHDQAHASAVETLRLEIGGKQSELDAAAERERVLTAKLEAAGEDADRSREASAKLAEDHRLAIGALYREIAERDTAQIGRDETHSATIGDLRAKIAGLQASLDGAAGRERTLETRLQKAETEAAKLPKLHASLLEERRALAQSNEREVALGTLLKSTQAKADLAQGLQRKNEELRARVAGGRAGGDADIPQLSGDAGNRGDTAPRSILISKKGWIFAGALAVLVAGTVTVLKRPKHAAPAADTPAPMATPATTPTPHSEDDIRPQQKTDTLSGEPTPQKSPPGPADTTPASPVPSPTAGATSTVGGHGYESLPESFKQLVKQADTAFKAKNYPQAETLLRRVLEANPGNHFILANLGAVLIELGKIEEAETMLREALKIAPDNSFALTSLGVALIKRSQLDSAAATLSMAISLDPLNYAAHNYLGFILCSKGDYTSAQQELERSIKLQPRYPDAYLNLAVLFATSKPPMKELARQYYAKAIQLGAPHNATVEDLLR